MLRLSSLLLCVSALASLALCAAALPPLAPSSLEPVEVFAPASLGGGVLGGQLIHVWHEDPPVGQTGSAAPLLSLQRLPSPSNTDSWDATLWSVPTGSQDNSAIKASALPWSNGTAGVKCAGPIVQATVTNGLQGQFLILARQEWCRDDPDGTSAVMLTRLPLGADGTVDASTEEFFDITGPLHAMIAGDRRGWVHMLMRHDDDPSKATLESYDLESHPTILTRTVDLPAATYSGDPNTLPAGAMLGAVDGSLFMVMTRPEGQVLVRVTAPGTVETWELPGDVTLHSIAWDQQNNLLLGSDTAIFQAIPAGSPGESDELQMLWSFPPHNVSETSPVLHSLVVDGQGSVYFSARRPSANTSAPFHHSELRRFFEPCVFATLPTVENGAVLAEECPAIQPNGTQGHCDVQCNEGFQLQQGVSALCSGGVMQLPTCVASEHGGGHKKGTSGGVVAVIVLLVLGGVAAGVYFVIWPWMKRNDICVSGGSRTINPAASSYGGQFSRMDDNL